MFYAYKDEDEDEDTKPGIVIGETMIPLSSVQDVAAEAILLLDEDEPFVLVEEIVNARPTYDQIFRRIFHGEE